MICFGLKVFVHINTAFWPEVFLVLVVFINPFHPDCKTIFFHLLQIFRLNFNFLRPKHDR